MYNKLLDTFITCADEGSFLKAADVVHISANAVMKQINQLEEHLELKLFERDFSGLKLTASGKFIYDEAKIFIEQSDSIVRQAKEIEGSKHEKKIIRIGSSVLRPAATVMKLWKKSSVSIGSDEIELQVVSFDDEHFNYEKIVTNLGKNIDIVAGIFPSTLFGKKCEALTLKNIPVGIAVPQGHRLSKKKSLEISDLNGERLIMIHRGDTEYIDAVRDEIEANYPKIKIVDVEHYDLETFNRAVKEKIPMVSCECWKDVHPSLVTLPVKWKFKVPFGILYSPNASDAVRDFVERIGKIESPKPVPPCSRLRPLSTR